MKDFLNRDLALGDSVIMINPIWIIIDGGGTFVGHQGHFADTYFQNASERNIREFVETDELFEDSTLEIREMTAEEMAKYPEAVKFRDWLVLAYGKA